MYNRISQSCLQHTNDPVTHAQLFIQFSSTVRKHLCLTLTEPHRPGVGHSGWFGAAVRGTLKGYDQLMNLVLDNVHEVMRGKPILCFSLFCFLLAVCVARVCMHNFHFFSLSGLVSGSSVIPSFSRALRFNLLPLCILLYV